MTLRFEPVNEGFVAIATSIDLRQPLGQSERDAIVAASDVYGVLVFPGQHLKHTPIRYSILNAVLHRGRRFDRTEPREMRRVEVVDDLQSLGEAEV